MNFENLSIVDIQVHVRNTKPEPVTENSDWPDIIFRHYKDTDDLGIYFIKVTPGVLKISDNSLDDLLVSYDHNRKIISIDLDIISSLFHSNMFTVDGLLNAKFIKPIYDEDSDTLKINFVNINPLPTKIQKTTINDIEVEMDTAKKLITILFYNASKSIAKPLSEEEINFFAEKVE
ncbi:hypothetical protein C1646_757133 [Rhizophagus diaphanus]|nr:hypothetical protein C1646_757133 [Rhizophagus diaphanus] [Rhizophagus sp. MUCL 43196]